MESAEGVLREGVDFAICSAVLGEGGVKGATGEKPADAVGGGAGEGGEVSGDDDAAIALDGDGADGLVGGGAPCGVGGAVGQEALEATRTAAGEPFSIGQGGDAVNGGAVWHGGREGGVVGAIAVEADKADLVGAGGGVGDGHGTADKDALSIRQEAVNDAERAVRGEGGIR